MITAQTSSEEAEQKLGTLATNLAGRLRQMAARVQELRSNTDQNLLRGALRDYEATHDKLVLVQFFCFFFIAFICSKTHTIILLYLIQLLTCRNGPRLDLLAY